MQRLLVAGDNDEAARVHECLRSHYTRRGCSVIYCPAPSELMRQLKKSPPDAIFMHFQFAELTVYEIYQQIRSIKEGRLIPIMVLETEMLGGTSSAVETLVLLKMPLTVSHLIRHASNLLKQDVTTTEADVLCEPTFMQFEEEVDPEQEAQERRRQRLREHSIQLRDDLTPQQQFYLIPEQVRRRWFYNSDFVQGIFDRIEDSAWYQRRCRRKYGNMAPPPPPEPEDAYEGDEAPEEETPKPAPTPRRDTSPEAKRQRKARSGRIAIVVLLVLLATVSVLFAARHLLLANTICPQCAHQEEQVVWDIHHATCSECGGHVGFACKCEECGHEFAFIPGLDTRTRFGASMAPPCPECGSPKTVRLGP
jgi:CheY-like chemotaxis protein